MFDICLSILFVSCFVPLLDGVLSAVRFNDDNDLAKKWFFGLGDGLVIRMME